MSIESIESIASPSSSTLAAGASCAACGTPLAGDQRYCLQCGERSPAMSSVLAGAPLQPSPATTPTPPVPPGTGPPGSSGEEPRNNALTVIAGVGVLLLAMGIGVLIGRSTSSKPSTPSAPAVITVSSAPSAGAASSGSSEAESFNDDWPAGKSGYSVQLQTLPVAGTKVSAVQSAKSSAEGKGAKAVGALKSEDFSSLPSGNYVVYSGDYKKQGEAQKALSGLKKSFPTASVIHISGGSASGSGASSAPKSSTPSTPTGSGSSSKGGGGTASPKALEEEHKSSGKSYEEKSKNLPNVVGT